MDAEESDVPSWHTIARKPFVSRVEVEISPFESKFILVTISSVENS